MSQTTVIQIKAGPWLPDLPALNNPGLIVVKGLLPMSNNSYVSMPSFSPRTTGWSDPIMGFYTTKDRGGRPFNFGASGTRILGISGVDTHWEDMSPSQALQGNLESFWSIVSFGERVIFSNGVDPMQSLILNLEDRTSRLSPDPDAPVARYLAVVRDWLVAANLRDRSGANLPQRIHWSAIDNPTLWPPPGSDEAVAQQSDFQDLIGNGGAIQGIVGNIGTADAAIFMERAIYRMSFVGPPAIFSFHQVEGARGAAAPGSIITVGAQVFYLGEDGFYQFDGTTSVPIGNERINKTILRDINLITISRMSATVDPINSIVFWAYCSKGNSTGYPNRLLAYNWAIVNDDGSLGRWTLNDLDCQLLCRSLTNEMNLEQLDQFIIENEISTGVDGLPFSLDSRVWMAGQPLLSLIDVDGSLCVATPGNGKAELETGEFEAFPGRLTLLGRVTPLTDAKDLQVAVRSRNSQAETLSTPVYSLPKNGQTSHRAQARYHRLAVKIDGGAFSFFNGLTIEVKPGDAR
ncbi:MAG: hypothetical protein QM523_10915 [Candidatus Pacebacteria bacterium]|nr:hypothetical protein [Candidatus Paceibacterota bacterium]